jgi:hypothetical protein
MIESQTYSADGRISKDNEQDNELISLHTPYNLTFRCRLPSSIRFDRIIKLGLELIEKGIPVVPRDDGTSLIGPIFSLLDYNTLREVLDKHSLSAIFGYHPENNKFPICFDRKGDLISFGSPAIVSTYRVYDFNDCSLEDAFMLDENGNYEGSKGSRLSKVPLESILSSDDALSGLIVMKENPDFYQAVIANWRINEIIDSYCLYAKVDVNGFSDFINNPEAIFSMNNYFYRLSEIARVHRILTAENTGESIVLYPETIEQVKAIRDWIEQSKNPFTTKMVVLGPRMVRRLYVTTNGFCIKAEPQVEADKVERTEKQVKGKGGFFGHNMVKGGEGLHL